jgi:orotate phosphoribosyltransferase
MTETSVFSILEQVGAIITNSHIVYTSGRHGSSYINKDALYPHTLQTSQVCAMLAECFVDAGVEVVAAPTIGGVVLSQWLAYHLTQRTNREVLSVYAEEQGVIDQRVLRRGYAELVQNRRVLVAEDVITTGGSARKVIRTVQAAGGHVMGAAVICNRGSLTAEQLGVPTLQALINITMESWAEDECPLCQADVPINTRVGKGAELVARRKRLRGQTSGL